MVRPAPRRWELVAIGIIMPDTMTALKLIALAVLVGSRVNAFDPSIEGVWKSRGWGYIYEIRGSALQAFEVTSATCVRGFKAARLPSESPGQATFRTRSGDVF